MTSTVLCPFDVEMRLQQESVPQGLSYQDFTTSELGALSRALVAGSPREPAVKDLKDSHFPLGAVGSAAGESDFSKRSRSRTVEWSPVEVSTLIEAYISIYVVKRFLTSKDWAEFTRMVNSRVLNGNRCPDQCRDKIDNLKTKSSRSAVIKSQSTWQWFRIFDAINNVGRDPSSQSWAILHMNACDSDLIPLLHALPVRSP
ncbi:hypothetical protein MPTK1_1g10860 [Marchantia polymorpha subsp. ruderalis]|uniref:Myb/SANT-like DNA-binding domain-containing protein n=2 Tax=Marchantia polymorpha TaxID=3197 RepID=A0AAF6ANT3_MARPO|nr:hypothetical protein MARPO_0014s0140 [Marchantia polymorpha]BBM98103.1 hypothetical protein Mp_1g10860 [Marchantia polymorpha subsp. ruderalis]|eukprot:PTQ45621.1 hypothetical protein MARPO_0014s0140 [Marchantia polymorpha]